MIEIVEVPQVKSLFHARGLALNLRCYHPESFSLPTVKFHFVILIPFFERLYIQLLILVCRV